MPTTTQNTYNITEEQLEKLQHYLTLLKKWQSKINLISNSTVQNAWQRHFEDSLQLLPLIPDSTKTLIDMGSGAGFPGAVIAITRPKIDTYLIESDNKKCSFLKALSRETNTPFNVISERIEDSQTKKTPQIITARALAPLGTLLALSHKWTQKNPDIQLILMKGEKADEEITQAKKFWSFEYHLHHSKTSSKGKILTISNISKK